MIFPDSSRWLLNRGLNRPTARVLSQAWVEASTRPDEPLSPMNSLLWWLIREPGKGKLTIDNALLARCAASAPIPSSCGR